MRSFEMPRPYQLTPEVQRLLDDMQQNRGKVPNLLAVTGYSPQALKGFLGFEDALSQGVFSAREREAIALVVSQVQHSPYGLAWHTAEALKTGLTAEEIRAIRVGEVADRKLNAIVRLARSVVENQGRPEESMLLRLFMAGYQEAGAIELVGLVTLGLFTDYLYTITPVAVDFPPVEPLVSTVPAAAQTS
jgi:AhpD family alkylhydroperoxidase